MPNKQMKTLTIGGETYEIHDEVARNKGGGFSDTAKLALLNLLEHVAYTDEDGQDYLDALEAALTTKTLISISAVFTQGDNVIHDTDSLDTLEQYLVVTANYDDGSSGEVTTYTLSGTLAAGTSTISVSYSGKSDTFEVVVVGLSSISAVFTQGQAVVYDTDSLDTLDQYLVVTANYSDGTSGIVTGYTLSGILTAGTSNITVTYGGQTDTFSVTVTTGFLYTPDKGKLSDQSYVTVSGALSLSETVSNNILTLSYTHGGTSNNKKFDFSSLFNNSEINGYELVIKFKIVNIGYSNTTNNASGVVRFERYSTSGRVFARFIRYGSSSATPKLRYVEAEGTNGVWGPDVSLNTWHTAKITTANGIQTVTLDDVQIASIAVGSASTNNECYFIVYDHNTNDLNFQIEKIEAKYSPS